MNVCVLGGGNIGTFLLGDISVQKNDSVRLLTSKPEEWSRFIDVYSMDGILKHTGKVDVISNKPEDTIKDADIILSTLPSHIFPEVIKSVMKFVKAGAIIGVIPGIGGKEFFCKELIENGCSFFGFQRVPAIARVLTYGKSVYELGKKSELYVAAIPHKETDRVCELMENMLQIKCKTLNNYLNVTLTPSNPILHTARLYSMFRNYEEGVYYDSIYNFYADWTDDSSSMLIECDNELQSLCRMLNGLDLTGVRPLTEHYESNTSEQMTKKISSIISLGKIKTPMICKAKGFIPDLGSRYFVEDFPYGLCIIKGFCEIVGLDTPNIDKVLMWFERLMGAEYYINGRFKGKDLNLLPLPQNFGLTSVNDIIDYYR